MAIHRDKSEIGLRDLLAGVGNVIFDRDSDADLHRGLECAVDRRLQHDHVSDVDGHEEIDVIHGGRDDVGMGVPMGGQCAGEIDPVHESPAQ